MRLSRLNAIGFGIIAATIAATLLPASTAIAQRRVYRVHHGGYGYSPYLWTRYERPGAFEFHRWRLPPERRLRYTDTPIAQRWGGYSSSEGLGYPFAEDYSNNAFFRRQVDAHRFDQPVPSGRFEGAAAARARAGVVAVSIDHLLQYPAPTLDDPGWDLLCEGETIKALGRFTGQKMTRPGDALPLIGYGIAAALYGDDQAALESFRDALRAQPQVVRRFKASDGVEQRIRELIDRYSEPAEDAEDAQRASLLAASLHCLLHEYDAAGDLIDELDEGNFTVHVLADFIAATTGEGESDEAARFDSDAESSESAIGDADTPKPIVAPGWRR
jgi:hypothetical protein